VIYSVSSDAADDNVTMKTRRFQSFGSISKLLFSLESTHFEKFLIVTVTECRSYKMIRLLLCDERESSADELVKPKKLCWSCNGVRS
jgi:hypothetical protein